MRKPVSAFRCDKCDDGMMELDTGWVAPEGIDPRMYRFKCEKGHIIFKVIGEKQSENLAEPCAIWRRVTDG